jgi:transposase
MREQAADAGAGDEEIARSVRVGASTVYRTKRRFVLGNLETALSEEPRPGADRKLAQPDCLPHWCDNRADPHPRTFRATDATKWHRERQGKHARFEEGTATGSGETWLRRRDRMGCCRSY